MVLDCFNLHPDDINEIIKEWVEAREYEAGEENTALADLMQIAREHVLKRAGLWEEYEASIAAKLRAIGSE